MIVKALDKEWRVKEISYRKKRELHAMGIDAFWNSGDDAENMNMAAYRKLLDAVEKASGLDEEELNQVSMADVDILLQAIYNTYMGLDPSPLGG